MATQQGVPSRPWSRLATMVRPLPPPPPPPQPDQPQPPPRPTIIRPSLTRVPSPQPPPPPPVTSSPPPPQTPPPPPPVTSSPPPQPPAARATPSPTFQKEPPPQETRTTSPPSPLVLPQPQIKPLKFEQKNVVLEQKTEKPETYNTNMHSEDVGRFRMITIAGENKGAIMDLTPFNKKTNNIKKSNDDGDNDKSASDSDSKTNAKNKNRKLKSPIMNAVMNSNVQGVNNSILYNSSTTHHDPGVHLSLRRAGQ